MTKKTLSITEFAGLINDLQIDVLHRHGVYVGKRKVDTQTVVLFQLNNFYVELYYSVYRRRIDKMITSESTEILHPYLDQIKLEGLRMESENE